MKPDDIKRGDRIYTYVQAGRKNGIEQSAIMEVEVLGFNRKSVKVRHVSGKTTRIILIPRDRLQGFHKVNW